MREATLSLLEKTCNYMEDLAIMVREDTNEAVSTNDHIAVIKHYNHLRLASEKIKAAREALAEIQERLNREQVPDVMRAHGVRTITVEGVGRVSLSNRWSCSMLDKEAGMDWLREEGHGGLIIETVNSQTLASFAKGLHEDEGMELPDDIFKTSIMTVTSITKV